MDLHPHEIKILKALDKKSSPEEISSKTGLDIDAVLRASSWLKTKKLVEIEKDIIEEIQLTDEGRKYSEIGLPERRIIDSIETEKNINDIRGHDKKELDIGLGWLRRKGIVEFDGKIIKILKKERMPDELLLDKLRTDGTVLSSELDIELRQGLGLLKKRQNVINAKERKIISLIPTKDGINLSKKVEFENQISQLTPELIISGKYKSAKLRPYDVSIYISPKYPAKKHILQRMIDRIRDIFVEMGFKEITGPLVESAFWNFDALFQPQDHPARDMHDTFYLKNPKEIKIDYFEKYKNNVKKTHEDGWTTGSVGYQYKWEENIAKKTVLRTHTTAVTVRYLSKIKRSDLPVRVFSIGKVFRNEAVDYKHLPEFYQVEGIVADENANFRHLLGILKKFYDEMGFKVRFRPSYFPYTEMSVEPEIYIEERKEWIELGGAGIFRPEVVKPILGFDCPVLAWGLGLDRVVALKLGLTDIRDLYLSDLDWLRKSKI